MAAEVSDRLGFDNPADSARPVHNAPVAAAAPPAAGGRQLNADQSWSIGGPAQAILGRVANMARGATEGRPGGGGIPGMTSIPGMGGEAAEGAAGAAEGAAGIGEVAADLAPLALLA
jgi:hypothetical protein